MNEIIIPFYTTNAALVAVKIISLNAIVKKVAHGAKIGGELDAAFIIAACLRHRLFFITRSAHYFFNGVPVHFMCLGVIVTVATHIHFVTTRSNQAASAHIVLAT
jgi:Na+-translocating ferredoxin:NAD+ oxidoreductase RnfA subunit